MSAVTVDAVERRENGEQGVTSATVTVNGTAEEWAIEHPAWVRPLSANRGDIFVLPALFLAMRLGLPLSLADAVSRDLRAHLDTIQDIYTCWFPDALSRVAVSAPEGRRVRVSGRARGKAAMSFTGGVDSTFSLLHGERKPDFLINAAGLDIAARDQRITDTTRDRLSRVARDQGATFVQLRTDIRKSLLGHGVSWGEHAHGALLASFGHLLAAHVDAYVIPATHTYKTTLPWGSTPLADPLYGSERLAVIHDGAAFDRTTKTERIAHSAVAKEALRVCLKISNDENCGECHKCLRTMLTLDAVGALSTSQRFPHQVDLALLDAAHLHHRQEVQMMVDVRSFIVAKGAAAETVAALDKLILRSRQELGLDG